MIPINMIDMWFETYLILDCNLYFLTTYINNTMNSNLMA